ncbi:type II toxin-antitoxin system prevent-host-death family antitoxin [Candidatus Halobeggiatoa sp. HSG11]|nr:type II toxin-antitoxin system prevent-host-death family antitoxin [Candidatus Halobeggiatoa sp. HSG11]
MIIVANDLRTKGVHAIKEVLTQYKDAIISVRGKPKYVVLEKKRYDELQK